MKLRWPLLLAVIVLVGCRASMPDNARVTGESLAPAVDRTADTIAGFERDHQALLTNPAHAVIQPFAARAGFDEAFKEARAHLERARDLNKTGVLPHLRENRPEGVDAMMKAYNEAKEELDQARAAVDRISKTRTSLLKAASDLPSFSKHAGDLATPLKGRGDLLRPAIQRTKGKHPAKSSDLDLRFGEFKRWADDVQAQRVAIDQERAKKTPDLLDVVRADERAVVSATEAEKLAADLDKRMTDLDRSVTRRLEDMRLDYEVTFARSSWDELSDWDTEGVYPFRPVKISLHLAEKLSKLGGEGVNSSLLREAGLNPYVNLPSGHDSYEFWIEDMDDQAYQKYVETVDGKSTTTDWIPVEDAFFEKHEKNLGMEIYAKPYGMYDDEAITTATPPGLAFVGNRHYGHWSGSTWTWLPAYFFYSRLFDGNHFYRRDQWDDWNRSYRNQRPYYGPGEREEERQYGTNGRWGRVYYGNSTWGRTTGFRTYDLSFRGLGPEYRGGGPGGGGK